MGNKKEKVFSGFIWKFGERIIAQVVSFVVSIILARQLTPDHYGVVALMTVFIIIADVFVTSGFSTSLVQKKDATDVDFSTIFICSFLTSVLLYAFLFVIAPLVARFYNEPLLAPGIRILSIKVIISSYNSIQHAYVQRNMMFKKFFFSTLFGTVISALIGIFMAYHGFGVWSLIAQYLINSIIDTIVLFFTVPWRPKLTFSVNSAKKLMSYGWRVLVTDLISQIFNSVRSFFIGVTYTSADLGFYNKGQQIPNLIGNNIDSTISTVLFPAMADEGDDIGRVKIITQKSLKISSYVMFPVMIGIAAVAKPLINVLLTSKWSETVVYLQLFCLAQALYTISNSNLQAIKAIGRSDVLLKLELIKKPIAIFLVIWGLKTNMFAVAISLPLYNLIGTLINVPANSKLLGYTVKEQFLDLLPAVVLSALMFIVVTIPTYFISNDFVLLGIQIIVGMLVYLLFSILFKIEAYTYIVSIAKKKIVKGKKNEQ